MPLPLPQWWMGQYKLRQSLWIYVRRRISRRWAWTCDNSKISMRQLTMWMLHSRMCDRKNEISSSFTQFRQHGSGHASVWCWAGTHTHPYTWLQRRKYVSFFHYAHVSRCWCHHPVSIASISAADAVSLSRLSLSTYDGLPHLQLCHC